jgi:hypothetical protein
MNIKTYSVGLAIVEKLSFPIKKNKVTVVAQLVVHSNSDVKIKGQCLFAKFVPRFLFYLSWFNRQMKKVLLIEIVEH